MIREGFWKWENEPNLPMPVARDKPFLGQHSFLGCLARVEARLTPLVARGVSRCRLCGCANGNKEYSTDRAVWPEGLRHYVEVHNVMPSEDFVAHIAARSIFD